MYVTHLAVSIITCGWSEFVVELVFFFLCRCCRRRRSRSRLRQSSLTRRTTVMASSKSKLSPRTLSRINVVVFAVSCAIVRSTPRVLMLPLVVVVMMMMMLMMMLVRCPSVSATPRTTWRLLVTVSCGTGSTEPANVSVTARSSTASST